MLSNEFHHLNDRDSPSSPSSTVLAPSNCPFSTNLASPNLPERPGRITYPLPGCGPLLQLTLGDLVALGQAHCDARSLHGRHGSSVCLLCVVAAGKRKKEGISLVLVLADLTSLPSFLKFPEMPGARYTSLLVGSGTLLYRGKAEPANLLSGVPGKKLPVV